MRSLGVPRRHHDAMTLSASMSASVGTSGNASYASAGDSEAMQLAIIHNAVATGAVPAMLAGALPVKRGGNGEPPRGVIDVCQIVGARVA
jgi:hypothetical protein